MSPKIYQALKSLFRLKKFEQTKMYFFINAEQENFLNKLKEMSENDIIEFSSSFSSFKKNEEIIYLPEFMDLQEFSLSERGEIPKSKY